MIGCGSPHMGLDCGKNAIEYSDGVRLLSTRQKRGLIAGRASCASKGAERPLSRTPDLVFAILFKEKTKRSSSAFTGRKQRGEQ